MLSKKILLKFVFTFGSMFFCLTSYAEGLASKDQMTRVWQQVQAKLDSVFPDDVLTQAAKTKHPSFIDDSYWLRAQEGYITTVLRLSESPEEIVERLKLLTPSTKRVLIEFFPKAAAVFGLVVTAQEVSASHDQVDQGSGSVVSPDEVSTPQSSKFREEVLD